MGKIEIGVSTLHLLNGPFNKMVKQITNIKANNIEIVDDGFHTYQTTGESQYPKYIYILIN